MKSVIIGNDRTAKEGLNRDKNRGIIENRGINRGGIIGATIWDGLLRNLFCFSGFCLICIGFWKECGRIERGGFDWGKWNEKDSNRR